EATTGASHSRWRQGLLRDAEAVMPRRGSRGVSSNPLSYGASTANQFPLPRRGPSACAATGITSLRAPVSRARRCCRFFKCHWSRCRLASYYRQTFIFTVCLRSVRAPERVLTFPLLRLWPDRHGETLVHHSRLLEFREQGCRLHPRAGQASTFRPPLRRDHRTDREGRGSAPRTKIRYRAQILSRLCAGESGAHRRGISPHQERTEGDRFSRVPQKATTNF